MKITILICVYILLIFSFSNQSFAIEPAIQSTPLTYQPLSGTVYRHMWCWSNSSITNNIGSARSDFYSFSTAPFGNPAKAVTYLYYSAHSDISSNTTNLRNFISEAHGKGFKVIFLDGDPNWVTSSANRVTAETVMDTMLNFNKNGTTNQRFDGVQYDVEPYVAPGWSTNSVVYWATFTTLLSNCQAKVNTYNLSYSPAIYFEVAIPRWYDTDALTVTSSDQCQDITDSVAIMDYVDDTTRLVNDAIGEINYADAHGKKVVVGVETQNISPGTSTFYQEGNSTMESRLGVAQNSFISHASFQGFAIHHYNTYKALNPVPVELSSFIVGE